MSGLSACAAQQKMRRPSRAMRVTGRMFSAGRVHACMHLGAEALSTGWEPAHALARNSEERAAAQAPVLLNDTLMQVHSRKRSSARQRPVSSLWPVATGRVRDVVVAVKMACRLPSAAASFLGKSR